MLFSEKQKEYIREANSVLNFKIGAVRSGKTFIDTRYIIPSKIRERAGQEGLNFILGVTESTIERNILFPMRQIYGNNLVGSITQHNEVSLFGEPCYAFGMEKSSQISKVQGASVKYCYGDEVVKWNKDAFFMLINRLDKDYSRLDAAGNPESPYHYLKEFIEKDPKIYCQQYTIDDNDFLSDEVKERIKRQNQGVYYKRYVDGQWSMAEGAIHDMWRDEINIIDTLDIEPQYYLTGIDYGTSSVCVFGLYAARDDQIRKIKEYRYDAIKSGRQKTDVEYRNDYANFINGYNIEYGYIDPSATSFRLELRNNGFTYIRAADNNVIDGIKKVQTKISNGSYKILRSCKESIREKSSYVWDKKAQLLGEDKPLKIDDHHSDEERYVIFSHFRRG